MRPGQLHKLTFGCKALNVDVMAIQKHRRRTNEETATLETYGYNFLYSTATERSQGGIGLFIAEKIARHILLIKSISNRLLLIAIRKFIF